MPFRITRPACISRSAASRAERFRACASLAALLGALMLAPTAASAIVILDQEHDPPGPYGSGGTSSTVRQAQTLTVGQTGQLVSVQLKIGGSGDHALDIYSTALAGHPDLGALLGSGPIPDAALSAASFGNDWVSIAVSIPVTAGDEIGLVLRNLGTGSLGIAFEGTPPDDYTGGGYWTHGNPSVNSGDWYPNGNNPSDEWDAPFRTFVEVVPEPSTALLLSAGLACLGSRRRSARGCCG